MKQTLPFETTLEVYNRCLCFGMHRAARTLARRFDAAFAPLGISHGQYSLMMSLNRPEPARMGDVASLLAMDRTTLTAALKPLTRRGLVEILTDPKDRRSRRLVLTDAGRALLAEAVPVWERTHAEIDRLLGGADPQRLRDDLVALS